MRYSRLCFASALLLGLGCKEGGLERPASVAPAPDAGGEPPADAGLPPPVSEPAPRLCSNDGWCWDSTILQNNTLAAVAGRSPSDVWAVGELGTVLHFDGRYWRSQGAPAREGLRALWVGDGEVWAVGGHATVLHYVNDTWSVETLPGVPWDAELRGVWAEGDGVWIAGTHGVLLERSAGAWTLVEAASGATLNAVWASGGEAWAVGSAGAVLRRTEAGWARVDAGTSQDLFAVRGASDAVWIAGNGGELRRYDLESATWARPAAEGSPPAGQLSALHVDGERVIVANERGQLHTLDLALTCPVPGDAGAPEQPCSAWREAQSTAEGAAILGVWASDDVVVAVGDHGSITRWHGDDRSSVSGAAADNYLDVSGTPAGELWVGGDRVLRRVDGGWLEIAKESPRAVYSLQALDDGRMLIAGTGGLARSYAGDAWHDMDVQQDAWLRALHGDGQSAWLVGSRGSAWGLLNGALWAPLSTPTDRDLLAVIAVPAGPVWAVGKDGVILRHDGTSWALIPSGPEGGVSAELRGVWGSASDDAWAVGTGGTALHWDGSVWSSVGEAASYSLNAVWGRARDDVWAAGSGGTLLHYDGTSWQPEFSGTSRAIHALWGDDERLWAVGERGTILVKELD